MITTINNWKPEVRSLLKSLTDAGIKLEAGHNGAEKFKFDTLSSFIENLIACDEANLYVQMPDGRKLTLYLVLGNSPGELVSDYTCHLLLDKVTEAHSAKWEGRKQPTKVGAYLKGKFVSVDTYRRAQRKFIGEVNYVIHKDNLYAHVGHDGQDRRVIDCHLNEKDEVVVRDLNSSATYPVKYTAFRNGRNQEVSFVKGGAL